MVLVPFRPLPLDRNAVRYAHGPDSTPRAGVRPGQTLVLRWDTSTTYPGTTRTVRIHVPAGHDATAPAGLVFFNDGWLTFDPAGEVRAGTVLDNLADRGDIPATIAVFVDPGVVEGAGQPKNRNVEYDAFDNRYANFLIDEIVPLVSARFALTDDPQLWAVCGGSSGGNAALTAAWMRPDRFGTALCFLSSFAQMPGGNPYPDLIPAVDRRPVRVFLQAGHRDLNNSQPTMNWLAENLRVAAALTEGGHDLRLVVGDGGHDPNHEGVLLPDALRWALGSPNR